MGQKNKKQKKRFKINSRPILSLFLGFGFLSIILLSMMLSVSPDTKQQGRKKANNAEDTSNLQEEKTDNDTKVAVITAIDTDKKKIELYEIERQEFISLEYSGGTNITDKYGKLISMSQIEPGIMVDIVYLKDKNKLTDMNISKKAWEYVGVNNLSINTTLNTMKIATTKYKFTEDIFIRDEDKFISVTNLAEQDELTIRGFEETIWSITVTRGHGTVILQDYGKFLGSNITIGYESIQQIKENMEITVREGSFNLTVDTGKYSATKNITVNRNKITYVSLSDLGPDALKQGNVIFQITPFGADLYLEGELISYANAIELYYGEYDIKVSMGGYTTYQGVLKVDSAGKTIKIDLPENGSNEDATVTETEDSDSTNGQSGTGSNAGDNTSGNDQSSGNNSEENQGDNSTNNSDDASTEDIDEGHMIYVQQPEGASVYIDGEYKCTSPGSFPKLIGTYVITFIKDGYETMSYTIEVSDDDQDTYFTFPDLIKK